MTKKEQWQKFSKLVENHIDNYVIPQYGEFPDKMIEGWDVFNIETNLIRYVARIGTNVRGISEQKRDALKIAHYACYLLAKLEEK